MEAAIEAGAEDVTTTDQYHEVMTEPEALNAVKTRLEEKKIPIAVSELSMIPTTEVDLDQRKADQMMRLMEALEDHDDVQHVWANANFAEEAG
jgi:transcriptional/translational regulatory protein YebC/TACO1